MAENSSLAVPKLPDDCPRVCTDGKSLAQIRDLMTSWPQASSVKEAISTIMEAWRKSPRSVEPLLAIQSILDNIRASPRCDDRVLQMNTLVRSLGQPEEFATLLDMLRDSSKRMGTLEGKLSEASRNSTKHAVYGWCGQTRLLLSSCTHVNSAVSPEAGVARFLGKTPIAAWSLSMHIWQPNANANGFLCGINNVKDTVAEPPHSHPFDFASMVVAGRLHQTTFAQGDSNQEQISHASTGGRGRYDGVKLIHVDGVWPPHHHHGDAHLVELENRVELMAGDSYYMSADMIHDVEVDTSVAQHEPAVTLFLRSETYVAPHVYMAPEMAAFHSRNPDLKESGRPLTESDWNEKLRLVADYIRGRNKTLNLNHIVRHHEDYAFFHR